MKCTLPIAAITPHSHPHLFLNPPISPLHSSINHHILSCSLSSTSTQSNQPPSPIAILILSCLSSPSPTPLPPHHSNNTHPNFSLWPILLLSTVTAAAAAAAGGCYHTFGQLLSDLRRMLSNAVTYNIRHMDSDSTGISKLVYEAAIFLQDKVDSLLTDES